MSRLDNTWERGRALRLGLQFFAEEMGDESDAGGYGAGGEMEIPSEGDVPDTATTNDGNAQSCYDAMSREERAEFLKKNGLMHHTAATARYKSATDKAAKLDGLHSSFADLAKVYGLEEGDYAGILRAALDRPHPIESTAAEGSCDAVSEEASVPSPVVEEKEPVLYAEEEIPSAQDRVALIREAELLRMIRQEEETRAAYPSFDFGAAARNPAFKAMVDAGLPMKAAYESAFHAELSAAAMEAVREQARAEALAEYRANRSRPEEGATHATGEAIMTVDYRQMTKEQLRAVEKKYL